MPTRRFLRWLFALAVFFVALPAWADDAVDDLKKRGAQAMSDLNYREALDLYRRAQKLAPDDAALHYNVGRAHQALGELPEALDAVQEFAKRATPELRARVPKLEELLRDLRAHVGELTVRCSRDVADGRVSIAGRPVLETCTTAPKPVRIALKDAGKNVIEVSFASSAFDASPQKATVEGGASPSAIVFEVVARATSGILKVRSPQTEATVLVDGVARGNPPVELPLPAGGHSIELHARGYDDKQISVVVSAGATKEVDVPMAKSAPITAKWWFWTGVGVVVLAAAATTYILVAQPEREARTGDIQPGQVSAPLLRFP